MAWNCLARGAHENIVSFCCKNGAPETNPRTLRWPGFFLAREADANIVSFCYENGVPETHPGILRWSGFFWLGRLMNKLFFVFNGCALLLLCVLYLLERFINCLLFQ